MFMYDVTEQTAQAEAQAKSDAEAEEEARRSDKPVKRKKTDDTNKFNHKWVLFKPVEWEQRQHDNANERLAS